MTSHVMAFRIFIAAALLSVATLHQYAQTDIADADAPIVFACDSTKAACLRAGWDTDGDGELSYREAAAVTHLGEERFAVIRSVLSFDELQYFTGLRSIDRRALADTYNMATVTLPPQLEELDERAFWSATGITHITLPPSLRKMGAACFYHCEKLVDITIPGGVDTVPHRAFMWCMKLVQVTLQEGVSSIDSEAFRYCVRLQEVSLPASLKSIGHRAFFGNFFIKMITCAAPVPPELGENIFEPRVCSEATLFVPQGSLEAYRSAKGWKLFRYISELF